MQTTRRDVCPGQQTMKNAGQRIRYVRTKDGAKLAWAEAGSGPPLVKAANWMTHLEYEWESPVWRHWIKFFTDNFRYIRHDERGCGMTEWNVGDLSLERWIGDLEAVVESARDRKSTRLNSSHLVTSYAVFCLKKKNHNYTND